VEHRWGAKVAIHRGIIPRGQFTLAKKGCKLAGKEAKWLACAQEEELMINFRKSAQQLALIWLAAAAIACAQNSKKPQYEVYAVRYATLADFPVSALIQGADPARKLDIAMTIWLVKGNGRNILVDSGFYREQFLKRWKPKDFMKPAEAVAALGVKPEDVTDVIITHMHWDHADGMDLFPKARIWVQKDEYIYYAGEAWQHNDTHGGIDKDDVLAAVRLNMEGRLGLVNGDAQEIIPGITCYTGGKHTYQSQYVGVSTKDGAVVLASDNMYLYENLEKHVPIAQTLDADSNLRAQDRMKQIAAKPGLIIPGHDPAVFDKFPRVNAHVVKIE
jgi:glyoxylase-like metal-dependent hydrolase (beta-lactamase superfamily II)